MQTTTISKRTSGFTLIEMLTVISVIGVLAALLLPALNTAREKSKRVGCASNLHQIGLAMFLFAADNQNHFPSPFNNPYPFTSTSVQSVTVNSTLWYTALTNGYTTAKNFVCPDDVYSRGSGIAPRSYAIVVADSNPGSKTQAGNQWIAGSRLTCPYLTNTSVAIVAEYYGDNYGGKSYLPALGDDTSPSLVYVTGLNSSGLPLSGSQGAYPPLSRHDRSAPWTYKGNYLFMDGHVEWVENPGLPPKCTEMFPLLPPQPQGSPSPFVPCP
ncbi:MAG TPA: type II secretion system protein [Verrucomicrobiae bacterium]|nr:type II secretion system protein [Verrucomicrobiae bacterium]